MGFAAVSRNAQVPETETETESACRVSKACLRSHSSWKTWLLQDLKCLPMLFGGCVCFCRCVVPIGMLFAVTLWMGNAAYMYLSVSFIQMLKVRAVHASAGDAMTGPLVATHPQCSHTSISR
jgi:hypothetical protein